MSAQLTYIHEILYNKYYTAMYDENDTFPSVINIKQEEEELEDKENEVEKTSTPIETFIN